MKFKIVLPVVLVLAAVAAPRAEIIEQILVKVNGEIVGGVGISAGTAVQDVAVAEQALKYFYEKTGYAP